MKIRVASLLLALALPLAAQEPTADQTEAIFYKAFYLEKGQRDFAGAMSLYEQFLAKAPDSKLAAAAAKQQFNLLDATGKTKERDAFKAKYEKLLGNIANAPAAGAGAGAGAGDRPARGEGEGRPGAGARPDQQARIAELEKQLEKAKADGKEDEVKRLEQQIERAKAGGRGPGGGQGRNMGAMGVVMGQKKVSEMTAEEVGQLKEYATTGATRMIDRMKQNGQEDAAKKLEANTEALKKALEANKTEDAQKALDALREAARGQFGGRGRGGQGGGNGNGGGNNGGGGNGNGGGGNNGGGGGNNGGGGGGGR